MSCFYLPDECDEITAVTVLYFIVTDTYIANVDW